MTIEKLTEEERNHVLDVAPIAAAEKALRIMDQLTEALAAAERRAAGTCIQCQARAETAEARVQGLTDQHVADGITIQELRSRADIAEDRVRELDQDRIAERKRADDAERELAQLRERVAKALKLWGDFRSQEMYGELFQEGMEEQDHEAWSDALEALRGS